MSRELTQIEFLTVMRANAWAMRGKLTPRGETRAEPSLPGTVILHGRTARSVPTITVNPGAAHG